MIGPDVKVFVASSAYDLTRQNSQIDYFITKKVDLIMLIATDPVAIEPAVHRAQAKGISHRLGCIVTRGHREGPFHGLCGGLRLPARRPGR